MLRYASLAFLVLLSGCLSFGDLHTERLFDGKTLDGWVTSGGHYDGNANWTVEDGAITGRQGPNGEGGLIYTAHEYSDFLLGCDVKIEEPMDSGIFLCMVPGLRGYQVTIDTPQGGELGGIYSDGWLQHNPDGWKHFRVGEWNTLLVDSHRDEKKHTRWIILLVNGERTISYEAPEDPTVFARAGRIGLQVHGGQGMAAGTKVQFRNLELLGDALDVQPYLAGAAARE